MKDITYYNKRCAELDGFKVIGTGSDRHYKKGKMIIWELDYHRIYDWQIPVLKKIYSMLLVAPRSKAAMPVLIEIEKYKSSLLIESNTAEDSFVFLSKAIDFIDANQSNN